VNTPQLPLGFRFPPHQRLDQFVAGVNAEALAATTLAASVDGAPSLFLAGPEGSGKTHLAIAICQHGARSHALYVPLRALGAQAADALAAIEQIDLLVIDDVDAVAGRRDAEIALFDVFNRGRAQRATLVFTAKSRPGLLPLVLPDLASRLSSLPLSTLRPLDDAGRREVVRKRAEARGIELGDDVIEFLFRRQPRDLGALVGLVDRLDRESLAEQRRVTVPFLRRVIGLPSRPDG
jgi:DnaA family protein